MSLYPKDANPAAARGRMRWRNRQFREAAEDYAEASHRDPTNVDYLFAEIECRKAVGDETRTAVLARRAVALAPENPKALVYLGHHLATLSSDPNAWTEAREILTKATRLAPTMPIPFVELGSLLCKMGDWNEAEAYLQSGWQMLHLGQKPLRQLESMAVLEKRRSETAYALARCAAALHRTGDQNLWVARFREVDKRIERRGRLDTEASKSPPNPRACAELAQMDIETGGAAEAVDLIQRGLTVAPADPSLLRLKTILENTKAD